MEKRDSLDIVEESSRKLKLDDEEHEKSVMRNIDLLKESSQKLYLDEEELNKVSNEVLEYVHKFFSDIPHFKAFDKDVGQAMDIFKQGIMGKGTSLKNMLELFHSSVVKSGLQPTSGGHMGYIPAGGIPLSWFGDFIAAATNKYTGVYTACPGGVNLEKHILEWTASLYGFDKTTFGGNLCAGASIGIVMCVAAARDKYNIKAREYENLVSYTSDQAHFCLEKALKVTGMRESKLRMLATDSNYSIDTSVLERTIEDDVSKGLKPFIISGSIGTTGTGSVDDIDKLAALAQRFNCWFHVDAAYGGFFRLLPEMKEKFAGVENADSICVDAHKSLFLPYGSGIVLVKNREDLLRVFSYSSVLIDTSDNCNQSPADLSMELTRNFRGLRMWFPLLYHGVDRFADALREKVILTRYAYNKMKKMNFIDVGPNPPLTVFIFRFNGRGIYDDNKLKDIKYINLLNKEMREAFQDDGRVYLTNTVLDGEYWIRVAVLGIRTHKKDMDTLLEMVLFHFGQRSTQ